MNLLIAEKPSVGVGAYRELLEKEEGESFRKMDGYLQGRRFQISWCVGHLVELAPPEAYGWKDWDLKNIPMIPDRWQYQVQPSTKKQFRILSELCKKADLIINGGDAGREGELIVQLVLLMAGCQGKPQKRLWLSSFDTTTMVKGWRNPRPSADFKSLYHSALARARADWLIGMNGTVGYSVGTGQRGLSVGRVQTPTLALIVKRDLEVESWTDRVYYQLHAFWQGLDFTFVRDGETDFENREIPDRVGESCKNKTAVLNEFEKQDRKQNSLKPFDLPELQKAANRVFGFKAKKTLDLTQRLYEGKFVTYPRTDSQYLPEPMKDEAWDILQSQATPKERELLRNKNDSFAFFNSAKVSDHFAIIPTGMIKGLEGLAPDESKVYGLIRDRFVQAWAKPYLFEEYKLAIECEGHLFKARATREVDPGFKSIKVFEKDSGDDGKKDPGNRLTTPLNKRVGESRPIEKMEVEQKKAAKPSHYNEATLLSAMGTAGRIIEDEELREAMKERGLGTPATKAAIIERLKAVGYIETRGKSLISTSKGRGLIDLVDEKLKSPEMTGEWEYKLNKIAEGKYEVKRFKEEIIEYVHSLTPSYTSAKAKTFSEDILVDGYDCPKCRVKKLVVAPKVIKCVDPVCGFVMWPMVAGKKLGKRNLEQLLSKGRTGVVKGFKSKAGKEFEAKVVMGEDWKVGLEF